MLTRSDLRSSSPAQVSRASARCSDRDGLDLDSGAKREGTGLKHHPAGERSRPEERGPGVIELLPACNVREHDRRADEIIHREPGGGENRFDVDERLANLIRERALDEVPRVRVERELSAHKARVAGHHCWRVRGAGAGDTEACTNVAIAHKLGTLTHIFPPTGEAPAGSSRLMDGGRSRGDQLR